MVDALDLEHVLTQPFQVGWHHHFVADNARLIFAAGARAEMSPLSPEWRAASLPQTFVGRP
jgi:urease beta subunit